MGPTAEPAIEPRSVTIVASMRSVLRLHGHASRPLIGLILVGIVSGIAEAGALVLFIRAAMSITADRADALDVLGVSVGSDPPTLLALAALFVVVAAACHLVLSRGSARLSLQILTNARTRLIDGFMFAEWSYQSAAREGTLQEATSNLAQRASQAATYLVVGASTISILVALIVSAVAVQPVVSLALLAAMIPVLILLQPLTRSTRRRSHDSITRGGGLAEQVAATTTLAREFRTFGLRRQQAEHLNAIAGATSASQLKARTTNMLASFLFKDFALLSFIVIVGVLYLVVDLSASATTAAVLIIIRSLGYAQLTYTLVQSGAEDSGAILELNRRIEEVEAAAEPDGTVALPALGCIELDGLSFAYSPDRAALHSIDLQIPVGQALGLIGPSGAGKTTMAEILLGLRRPTAGHVRVGGHDLADIAATDWTRLCSFVPQDPRLVEGTIRENIRFFRHTITDDDVERAATQAHLIDAIRRLPDGFDTQLGARSQGLSGGQRQRLAIARALAGGPQLLILDEPTSALDSASEQLLRQTLFELKGSMTMVVIAHRPATIDVCDVVITLRDGSVAATDVRRPPARSDPDDVSLRTPRASA